MSDKVPQPGAQKAPHFLLTEEAQIFGDAQGKDVAQDNSCILKDSGVWILLHGSVRWSTGWQRGSSGPAVLISWLQSVSIRLPASTRYNQVR